METKKICHNSKLRKMSVNNPSLDRININAHANFGQILSIRSQDIERKQNSKKQSEISQGP